MQILMREKALVNVLDNRGIKNDNTKSSLKVAFIGCVAFSEQVLRCLLSLKSESIQVCAIVSKNESLINDDHIDLQPIAREFNIPSLDYQTSSEALEPFLSKYKPDVIYCFGWSHLIPTSVMNIAKYGAIGFHPTQLPLHRGRHPIIWTLALGLTETATSFFQLEKGADTGAILDQKSLVVDISDTASSLYEKIIQQAIIQVPEFTRKLRDGNAVFLPQDETKSSIWRKRGFQDGLIDWRMSALSIYNLIRALTKPYCGAQFAYKDQYITIWQSKLDSAFENYFQEESQYFEPGKILANNESSFLIQCGDHSTLLITKTADFPTLNVGEYL